MCLNRFCIDEDTAFEVSGIYQVEKREHKLFESNSKAALKTLMSFNLYSMEEYSYMQVIDSAFFKIVQNKRQDLQTHIVIASPEDFIDANQIREFILKTIKKYNIERVKLTIFSMYRSQIISKEEMEDIHKNKTNSV